MSVVRWVLLVIAIVVVIVAIRQIPQARRYLRMKNM